MTDITPAQAAFEAFHAVGDAAGVGTSKTWAEAGGLPKRAFEAASRAAITAALIDAGVARLRDERDEARRELASLREQVAELASDWAAPADRPATMTRDEITEQYVHGECAKSLRSLLSGDDAPAGASGDSQTVPASSQVRSFSAEGARQ